jgi:epoxyqueuosine reductase
MRRVISREQLTRSVKEAAATAGFDVAGVSSVEPQHLPELKKFSRWVEAGYAGDMHYLEKRNDDGELRRMALKNAAPWVKSVIVCALNYNTAAAYSIQQSDPARGWVSRYAWASKDYHDALMPRLRQVEESIRQLAGREQQPIEMRSYVDTGPVVERVYAKYAGIGWIGKNTCMINQKLGSWIFLGVILTSLELAADIPSADRCGSCTRCIEACPTDAIVAPGELDARRCIAYLTIEKRGSIEPELRAGMGHHVFGCDICQDVCPWNNKAGNAPPTSLPEFQPRTESYRPDLRELKQLSEDEFRRRFRGTPVKRAKYAGLRRNVAIAMGNSGDPAFVSDLKELARDPDTAVAESALWSLRRLDPDHRE